MSTAVRAYLPATVTTLATLRERAELPAGPAYAVTPALRAAAAGEADQEVLEFEAFSLAATASLSMLRDDPAAPRRRVVIAVDAPVVAGAGAQARLAGPVPLRAVAAIHMDGAAAEPAVAAALAAGAGDLDTALEWYDVSELPQLVS